jgi:sarcosine oxidase subunit gamma
MPELSHTVALEAGPLRLRCGVEVQALLAQVMLRVQVERNAVRNERATFVSAATAAGLPVEPGTTLGDEPRAWWLAPNGWFVTARDVAPQVLAGRLHRALAPLLHSVVEVSDAHVTLNLRGERTRDLLARGTGVDLRPTEFAPGRCIRTRCAHAPVLLRPLAGADVELIVERSLARQFREWLADAAVGMSS